MAKVVKAKGRPDAFLTWLDKRIETIQRENEANDYRVYWCGNDIDGCDALRVLKTIRLKYMECYFENV